MIIRAKANSSLSMCKLVRLSNRNLMLTTHAACLYKEYMSTGSLILVEMLKSNIIHQENILEEMRTILKYARP